MNLKLFHSIKKNDLILFILQKIIKSFILILFTYIYLLCRTVFNFKFIYSMTVYILDLFM